MKISKEILDEIALSEPEYYEIVRRLGREPNQVELGMFGALWSEHCGYKHSKPLLKLLPSDSPRLLVAPGAENAGVIDIGDGLAVVMKIESHNHPSAIEPFQGAATGVGGIVRDIFTMGARPVALLNSLRFGPMTNATSRGLFKGVISGISWYGNCIGIPDVGGEVFFSDSYLGNPLVNAMCVGLVNSDGIMSASASGSGNLLVLVGSDTGRDGIHGASGLASRTFEDEREMRPTVQVGNPFLEKKLIEACMEAMASGKVLAVQDLGAAGLTSTVVEAVSKGGSGAAIDVSKVPLRESGMTPYEVMLSESQERMLVVVNEDKEPDVREIFDKWDLESTVIGHVTDDGIVEIYEGEDLKASLPTDILTNPPLYTIDGEVPEYMERTRAFDPYLIPIPEESPLRILQRLLSSPNIASKEWIYRQYDHQVQTNTIEGPGGDAAVLRIKGTDKAIALATDGNSRYCYLDPFVGGLIAVAEACRNLSCVGAEPLALTDCLNFGNPERPDVYYQLERCISGMAEACEILKIPIISGNVSLYNETRGVPIWPTPVIGSLGLLDNALVRCDMSFKNEDDLVLLLGTSSIDIDAGSLSGSEYLEIVHGEVAGIPTINMEREALIQSFLRIAISKSIFKSAHDCSDGGLAVALSESSIAGGVGFWGTFTVSGRWDVALFGEAQSRVVVSLDPSDMGLFRDLAREYRLPWVELGVVGGSGFSLGDLIDIPLVNLQHAWESSLEDNLA